MKSKFPLLLLLVVLVASFLYTVPVRAHVVVVGNRGDRLQDSFNVCTLNGQPNPVLWILDTTKEITIDTCKPTGYAHLYNLWCETVSTIYCGSGAGEINSQSEFDPILPSGDADIQFTASSVGRAYGGSANSGTVILFWNHIEPVGTLGVSSGCWCGYYVGAEAAVVGSTTAPQTNFYAVWRDTTGSANGVLLGSIPQVGLTVHFYIDWHRYGGNYMLVHIDTNTGAVYETKLYDSNYPRMNDAHKMTIYGSSNIDALLSNSVATIDNPPSASFSYTTKGKTATFDASGSKDDVLISDYRWNFGDGSPLLDTAKAVTPHSYVLKGTYTVTLVAFDDHGYASNSFSMSVTV